MRRFRPSLTAASEAGKGKIMDLNEKGQCPVCKIKPMVYKTEPSRGYFCHRCSRKFNLETKQFMANFAWDSPYGESRLTKAANAAQARFESGQTPTQTSITTKE